MPEAQQEREDEKKPHIKKPLNAFMLYMREERPKVVAQCKVKESATINQILGQRVSVVLCCVMLCGVVWCVRVLTVWCFLSTVAFFVQR